MFYRSLGDYLDLSAPKQATEQPSNIVILPAGVPAYGTTAIPSMENHVGDFLSNDGTQLLWRSVTPSGFNEILTFSPVSAYVDIGQTISKPAFTATYTSLPTTVQLQDSVYTAWETILSPLNFTSEYDFTIRTQSLS